MNQMIRLFIFLVGMLSTSRPGRLKSASDLAENPYGTRPLPASPVPQATEVRRPPADDTDWSRRPGPPRRPGRVRRRVTWAAVIILLGLIFRKVFAWAALVALSAAFHLVGINVHLPHVR